MLPINNMLNKFAPLGDDFCTGWTLVRRLSVSASFCFFLIVKVSLHDDEVLDLGHVMDPIGGDSPSPTVSEQMLSYAS
jgi:hypothetical protein